MNIPRTVYQTWPSNSLPENLAQNLRHNQTMASGWTFRLYSDEDIEDFITTEYGPDMLSNYRKISPVYGAARADLFRYLLIYKYGGFYIDIKSHFTRELGQVLHETDEYLLGRWADCGEAQYEGFGRHPEIQDGLGEYQQWYLAAIPRHPFLEAVLHAVVGNINSYLPSVHGVGRGGVLRTTGPIPYTNAILPIQNRHPHRIIRSFSDLGLQYSYLSGTDAHHQLFKKHYSVITEPVVKMDLRRKVLDLSLRSAKRLRRLWPN